MNINTWINGYHVEAFDWPDGKNIYFCVQYFKPGARLSSPPALERGILISHTDREKVRTYTHSIAAAIMENETPAFPLFTEYRNGIQTIKNGKTFPAMEHMQ